MPPPQLPTRPTKPRAATKVHFQAGRTASAKRNERATPQGPTAVNRRGPKPQPLGSQGPCCLVRPCADIGRSELGRTSRRLGVNHSNSNSLPPAAPLSHHQHFCSASPSTTSQPKAVLRDSLEGPTFHKRQPATPVSHRPCLRALAAGSYCGYRSCCSCRLCCNLRHEGGSQLRRCCDWGVKGPMLGCGIEAAQGLGGGIHLGLPLRSRLLALHLHARQQWLSCCCCCCCALLLLLLYAAAASASAAVRCCCCCALLLCAACSITRSCRRTRTPHHARSTAAAGAARGRLHVLKHLLGCTKQRCVNDHLCTPAHLLHAHILAHSVQAYPAQATAPAGEHHGSRVGHPGP